MENLNPEQIKTVAVVIPCYRVREHVLEVIRAIPDSVSRIYCVDDACPDKSGDWIQTQAKDPRVTVLRHPTNQGVGGAVLTGFERAASDGAEILVKIDGDGQMNPADLPRLIRPILDGSADYTKGTRFYQPQQLLKMPLLRLFGNSVLSLVNKTVSGYWSILDPTNGFVAIHRSAFALIPRAKIEKRYFFESDMLFRLSIIRAVVQDVPIDVRYGTERSNLQIRRVALEFPTKYVTRLVKRIGYLYLFRDFNLGSISLLAGVLCLTFGAGFGAWRWSESIHSNVPATSGTVMLAALPIVLGFQLILAFLQYDLQSQPKEPIQRLFEANQAAAQTKFSLVSD